MTLNTNTPVRLLKVTNAGMGAGAVLTYTFGCGGLLNGSVRGNFHSDQDGTLYVSQGNDPGTMDLAFQVTQDTSQPDYQWPFSIILLQPYVQFTFTNGATPSTFLRAFADALALA